MERVCPCRESRWTVDAQGEKRQWVPSTEARFDPLCLATAAVLMPEVIVEGMESGRAQIPMGHGWANCPFPHVTPRERSLVECLCFGSAEELSTKVRADRTSQR